MNDINEIMPKIPYMKWGALMNKAPTNDKVTELNKIFPPNGKWHTVFEEKDHSYIDGNTTYSGALIENNSFGLQEISCYLENNDSYSFFKKHGGLIKTGPTHTNLMDIGLIIKS